MAGLTRNTLWTIASLNISIQSSRKFILTAVILPRVMCEFLVQPVSFKSNWNHLDILTRFSGDLGERISSLVLTFSLKRCMAGWLDCREHQSPSRLFGWVLAGPTNQLSLEACATSHHTLIATGDDLLRNFSEIEENAKHKFCLLPEERFVVQHFKENHRRAPDAKRHPTY